MNAIQRFQGLDQGLWLDEIDWALFDDGRLQTRVDDFSGTGLASNPTRAAAKVPA